MFREVDTMSEDTPPLASEIIALVSDEADKTECWRCKHKEWDVVSDGADLLGVSIPALNGRTQSSDWNNHLPCQALTCQNCGNVCLISTMWVIAELHRRKSK